MGDGHDKGQDRSQIGTNWAAVTEDHHSLLPRVAVQCGRVAWKIRLSRGRKFERCCLRRRVGCDPDILEE